MKNRIIPATVAAMALALTAWAVPHANAAEDETSIEICKGEEETRGAALITGKAGIVELNGVEQDSGLRVHGEVIEPQVLAFDSKSKTIPVNLGEPTAEGTRPILLTPPRSASGPVRLEIFDDYRCRFVRQYVDVLNTVIISGAERTVKPTTTAQPSGLTVTNRERSPITFSAVDEDGQEIWVTFGTKDDKGAEPILLTPGTNVDGPITLSFQLSERTEPRSFSIGVEGHSAGVDDNESASDSGSNNDAVTVTGTPGKVKATDTAQETGLSITNSTAATVVAVRDKNDTQLTAAIKDGKILVTPGKDVAGPITLTVTDEKLADSPRTFTIEVEAADPDKAPEDKSSESSSLSSDAGSSEDSDINWTMLALSGVVAAVIGVIVAVGGQFLPML